MPLFVLILKASHATFKQGSRFFSLSQSVSVWAFVRYYRYSDNCNSIIALLCHPRFRTEKTPCLHFMDIIITQRRHSHLDWKATTVNDTIQMDVSNTKTAALRK